MLIIDLRLTHPIPVAGHPCIFFALVPNSSRQTLNSPIILWTGELNVTGAAAFAQTRFFS